MTGQPAPRMHDVVIIGGGVIGLSLAYELSTRGATVAVLDQAQPGQEASWAGAGILPPGNPFTGASRSAPAPATQKARTPEALLRAKSHELWPAWSARLADETGIDNGFRRQGGLEVCFQASEHAWQNDVDRWQDEGVRVETFAPAAGRAHEPELSVEVTVAYRLPDMGQVRNPHHLKALLAACDSRGVEVRAGEPVGGFERHGDRVTAALGASGRWRGGQFVVASGAWSANLLGTPHVPVRPVRGQIVLLRTPRPLFRHVINVGSRYLVPRGDGRLLVGSTEEAVGFDKRNTAEGVRGLLQFAGELAPALKSAALERCWAGLRPHTPDGLPLLGRLRDDNLFVAAGHFRSGLQLSPGTAVVLAELLMGDDPSLPLSGFEPGRFVIGPS